MKSAPITTTQDARPESIIAAPVASAVRKPEHAAPMSNAPARVAPSRVRDERRRVRHQLVGRGGRDQHQVDIGRVDAGPLQARPIAAIVAWVSSRSCGAATCRARIPVRRSIQSGARPRRASISADSTIPSGTLAPTETAAAPPIPRSDCTGERVVGLIVTHHSIEPFAESRQLLEAGL